MLNEILNLNGVTALNKKQQNVINGGGTCAFYLPAGSFTQEQFGDYTLDITCPCTKTGVSKSEALAAVSGVSGAKWCCDSCSSASWL